MHLFAMILFSGFVSAVFAGLNGEDPTPRARVLYGLKVFASFMGIGMALAWVMYLL